MDSASVWAGVGICEALILPMGFRGPWESLEDVEEVRRRFQSSINQRGSDVPVLK